MEYAHTVHRILLFILLFTCHTIIPKQSFLYDGFCGNTIIQTHLASKKIKNLQSGDLILSKDLKNGIQVVCPVTHICKEIIPCYVEIRLEHETIVAALGQKFYLENHGWVTAQDLISSPELQAQFPEKILEIRQVNESIEVYKLTIANEHNFYITEKQLLAHNYIPPIVFTFIPAATDFIVNTVGPGAGPILKEAACAVGPAIGGWITCHIIQGFRGKKKEDRQCIPDFGTKDKPRKKDVEKKSKSKSDLKSKKDIIHTKDKNKNKGTGKKKPEKNGKKDQAPESKPEDKKLDAQAPGKPTENDGFEPPKNWDGKKAKHPKTGKVGWPDKDGNIWVPTGPGPLAHGGPHWDVQHPNGINYDNVYPGGIIRPGK